MAGGIRSKDVRTTWDDVTNDDKTKAYGSYNMVLEPEQSKIQKK